MIAFPPAKINLGLSILRKRPDNYHDIETVFYPIPWRDILEIIPSSDPSFSISGVPVPGNPEENLCVKAYHLVRDYADLPPVRIHLHKLIPPGTGLGGGSSDAAHTLRLLCRIFSIRMDAETLSELALKLGSDCPFFLYDHPMLGEGRGNLLQKTSIDLKGTFIVVAAPGIPVSTAEAYAGGTIGSHTRSVKSTVEDTPLAAWKDELVNDFETTVTALHPEIKSIKKKMYTLGAAYASLTGSGAAVFGLFTAPIDPVKAFGNDLKWSGAL